MEPDKVGRDLAAPKATELERRSVLRWLGQSTVLALGGDLLSACMGGSIADRGASPGGAVDAGDGGVGGDLAADAGAEFPFEPGDGRGEIFDRWYENTVDAQSIVDILKYWRLTVDGLVSSPMVLSFADVLALRRQDQVTDFRCVQGWVVQDVPWNGVALAHLLDRAGVNPNATHLTFHSRGGIFQESLPVDVAREPRTLLAYGVGGSTLPLAHGFPLRLVVPRLLGYKSAKYVTRIELTDHAVAGYWVNRGYSYEGEIQPDQLRPGKY